MAIGTPFALGSAGASSVTTTADAPIGSTIFGCVSVSGTVTSISDGTANTYILSASSSVGSSKLYTFYSINTAHDVPLGSTISASGSVGTPVNIAVGAVSGVTALDVAGTATNGSGGSPSVSTGTRTSAVDLIVGFLVYGGTGGVPTFTESTSFTTLTHANNAGLGTAGYLSTRAVSSLGSITYAPTLASFTPIVWGANALAFTGSSSSAAVGSSTGAGTASGIGASVAALVGAIVAMGTASGVSASSAPAVGLVSAHVTSSGVAIPPSGSMVGSIVAGVGVSGIPLTVDALPWRSRVITAPLTAPQLDDDLMYLLNRSGLVGTTFANLPTGVGIGTRGFVTDATSATFGATLVGGGSNRVPVSYDGAKWIIG